MTYALWLAEFILEVSGAVLSYRKRLTILFALLAWRAFMDLVTAAFFFGPFRFHYAGVMWAGRAVQYAILYVLGVQIAAKMVNEWRPIWQYVYKTLAIVASVATYTFVVTDLWEHKFLHAEAVTCFLLLAVVLLGWIEPRQRSLEEPWKLITLSLVIGTVGNALCAAVAMNRASALSLYPIPALASLLLWNLAALRSYQQAKKEKIAEWTANLRRQIMEEFVPINKADPYARRLDGNYLIHVTCTSCGDGFDIHAMQGADKYWLAGIRRCQACRQVDEWQAEQQKNAGTKRDGL